MTNTTDEGLKFLHAEIKNFKNITSRVIDINGMSLLVLGRNGAGKSSFIQALMSVLDSKVIPSEPIRIDKGEDEVSSIEVTIGNDLKKYILTVYFTPGNKKGRLVVTNEAGEVMKTPATFVKGLIGNISIDPTKWLNESAEKKLKLVKQLTGCELDIDKINATIKDQKAVMKSKKEQAEEMEAVLKNHGYSQEQIEKYSNAIPIQPIQDELTNISKSMETYSGVEGKMKAFKKAIEDSDKTIVERRKKVDELKAQIVAQEALIEDEFKEIEKNKANLVKGDEWFKTHAKPSVDEINKRLQLANEHNIHHEKINKHADQQRLMLKAKEAVATIKADIETLEKNRSDLISKSQLPIPGFTFDDDQIYIDGLPLEKGQLNTARLFDVAIDVAIAMKPTLKVVFLHEASLFDPENLKTIIQKIEDKGYMTISEIVTDTDLEIKFTEHEL